MQARNIFTNLSPTQPELQLRAVSIFLIKSYQARNLGGNRAMG